MHRPVRPALAVTCLAAVALAVLACGRSGTETPYPAVRGVPTPVLPLPSAFGDGRDGARTVTTTGGTVNVCTPLLSGGTGGTLAVSDATAFAGGDRVLLWQVQAPFTTSGAPGDVDEPDAPGHWEIVQVAAAAGAGQLDVQPAPTRAYATGPGFRAQACRLPQFSDVTIASGGALHALPWSEATGTGGILAFYVSGTLRVDGRLEAAEAGFEGGESRYGDGAAQDVTALVTDSRNGAMKGGGLDGAPRAFGRGNMANGGGGGNAHNTGGGGGGGYGAGGMGGRQGASQDDGQLIGGEGGRASPVPPTERLVMGGGGGAGEQDDPPPQDGGGDGGGIVMAFARTIAGSGVIRARGGNGPPGDGDGGGGAGAGGVVMLGAGSSSYAGTIDVRGGIGGHAGPVGAGNYRGPGGGGGGGFVLVDGVGLAGVNVFIDGGAAGDNIASDGTLSGEPWSAEPGGQGELREEPFGWMGTPPG